ncbi:TetR/AcrR family transcriptional regulator [Nitratireductor kimnyeongensis]|uniref:TetR/AcrR family transcriptional regulator n=1 Tax=Nitratireductor kimnyeongensis TaxID=430679 RepID=A0ABW0T6T1_9HYPH|nr:TetR/AcrR family transcriptional regulator [Nitratireductor kimnyeongensis]QZZ34381.1 TetR/AcrR family transcriptional regulator [Nitratireductor kimnyeongensis]
MEESAKSAKGAAQAQPSGRKRKRLSPDERRTQIVNKAIEFFAEVGFESSTRALAERLNITQPLLYRYFPSKEDLIAEVYEQVYVNRWQPEWSEVISDRSRSLQDRLNTFYGIYTDAIFDRKWMRIYLFAGLRGVDINRRYMLMVRTNIILPVIAEARHELGAPPSPCTEREIDFAWALHGGIFYFGIRKLIYDNCGDSDMDLMIQDSVAALLLGLNRIFQRTGTAANR